MADKHLTTIQPMFKRSAVCSARLSEPVWPAAHALNQPESGASGEMSEPRFLIDRLLQVDHFSYHFFFYLRIISEYFLFTNTFNKAFTFFFFFCCCCFNFFQFKYDTGWLCKSINYMSWTETNAQDWWFIITCRKYPCIRNVNVNIKPSGLFCVTGFFFKDKVLTESKWQFAHLFLNKKIWSNEDFINISW